jgi:hypothetical protein
MFRLGKTKRAAALGAATLALAVGATITVASPASADTTGGGCRGAVDSDPNNSHNPGVWATGEPGGVSLMPCSSGDNGNPVGGIYASLYFDGPANLDIYPCAQLIKVGTGQVADFGCIGDWLPANSDEVPGGGWQNYPMGFYQAKTSGEYVVQAGYWATINGVYGYYGGAQSWPVWVNVVQ